MLIHGVRRFLFLGVLGACGAVPVACLFSPIDYSDLSNGGAGACSSAEGCPDPSECRTVCVGAKCETISAPKDKVITQIEHDCQKRQCDGNGNVEVVPDPGDLPADDNNVCTLEVCDKAISPNAPAGSLCPNGVCDGNGKCATCADGIKNGNEIDIDCGGSECPHCVGEPCVGEAAGCQSGHCVDGVCCSTACDKKCESCVVSQTGVPTGTCAPITLGMPDGNKCDGLGGCGLNNLCSCEDGVKDQAETSVDCGGACAGCSPGTPCLQDFECKSSACEDGVCCEKTCKGPCEQCDVPGSMGSCLLLPVLSKGGCPMGLLPGGVRRPLSSVQLRGEAPGRRWSVRVHHDRGRSQLRVHHEL